MKVSEIIINCHLFLIIKLYNKFEIYRMVKFSISQTILKLVFAITLDFVVIFISLNQELTITNNHVFCMYDINILKAFLIGIKE